MDLGTTNTGVARWEADADPPARSGDALVDNGRRRVLPHLGMLAGAMGLVGG